VGFFIIRILNKGGFTLKKAFLFLALFFLLLSISCSGGGSSSGGGSGIPELSVNFENPTLRRGETLYLTISWSDSDGDILTLYQEEYYATARWDRSFSASELGITGVAGTVRLQATTNPAGSLGVHTFIFFLKDSKGHMSNLVTITSNLTAHLAAQETAEEKDVKIPLLGNLGKWN
jgi:hypothetical protein